ELEQKIKQLTNELEQAQNKEPPRTNEPSDYQDIKTELEQLRKQVVNSQDKELMKKVAELTDKINQRERESKNTASQ
ncbi:12229_t:CDS:1, partial [Racocetra persica]